MALDDARLDRLNSRPVGNRKFVLYWMQAAQRESYNHALEYSIVRANELRLPLAVVFAVDETYPGANARHFQFMLEGLAETRALLAERGARLAFGRGSPEEIIPAASRDAALVVTDRDYGKIQRRWRRVVASRLTCRCEQVETDVVVPVETVCNREAYSAAVLRPRIHALLDRFMLPVRRVRLEVRAPDLKIRHLTEYDPVLGGSGLEIDRSVPPSGYYKGGSSHAEQALRQFLRNGLGTYAEASNDPSGGARSGLSPYLHFGQISPLRIALAVRKAGEKRGEEAFLEELIVRRELAFNFVRFNPWYDSIRSLPAWATETLRKHASDTRAEVYTAKELERAATHDPFWNAAQIEMTETGLMHGYMRMYWGKKILEWSRSPAHAFRTALRLNDKYELDGRDPNGYAGVAWCFGKHDRPWPERPVFGKVRYMSSEGLMRKFDMSAYVERVQNLARREAVRS